MDETARQIGAVNCIVVDNKKLIGFNTDTYGFLGSITKEGLNAANKPDRAFILGTGGSSKAIKFVLQKLEIDFLYVSRDAGDGKVSYSEIESNLKGSNLFINTTPLGMFPDTNTFPQIPYDKLSEKDFLFDLVYNPTETLFLQKGKAQGAKTKNGLEMLELQADKSWEIWSSVYGL